MPNWTKTEHGFMVYRCRYSLHESREKFAERFLVNDVTIFNWESGRTKHMQAIHQHLLQTLHSKLLMEGRLVPVEVANIAYQKNDLAFPPA